MNIREKAKVVNQKDQMERRSRKMKLIMTSDSELDAQVDIKDIMISSRKKFREKKIPGNVVAGPLDNVSFHYESSVATSKYVVQRRIVCDVEIGEFTLDYKYLMNLIKAARL